MNTLIRNRVDEANILEMSVTQDPGINSMLNEMHRFSVEKASINIVLKTRKYVLPCGQE